jgi:hypothetical protein
MFVIGIILDKADVTRGRGGAIDHIIRNDLLPGQQNDSESAETESGEFCGRERFAKDNDR